MLPLLVELLFERSEALVMGLPGSKVAFEFLMELLHLGGQGGRSLLAASAVSAFALQFGGGSCQGRDGGAEAAFELKELILQDRLTCARRGRRGGGLRVLGLGAPEVFGAPGQALLQFVEAGVRIGWSRLCGGSPRRDFILAWRHPRGQDRGLRCNRWGGGWRLGLGSWFGRGSLEDVRDALKGERCGYPCPGWPWG